MIPPRRQANRALRDRGWNLVAILAVLGSTLSPLAGADTFAGVHYDARSDQLVVTMVYAGTNPNHTFTLRWDGCQGSADSGQPYQITAEVLDGQWNDAARQPYRKTVRFDLANLACRPAKVTLRTAPRFYTTVLVPLAPAARP